MMNETQLKYCDISDKAIINKSKSKHFNSETHKHKQKYEFNNPDIDEVNYILIILLRIVEKNYFHSFDYRCVYDIKLTNFTNNEEVILTFSIGYMEFKSQFYGLSKKSKTQEIRVLYSMR